MGAADPVAELGALARTFGADAAAGKLALLERLVQDPPPPVRSRLALPDTLGFVRAYPDDPAVHAAANAVAMRLREWPIPGGAAGKGYPGGQQHHPYSFAVLARLVRLQPGRLELHPDSHADEAPLVELLSLLLPPGEVQGLEDDTLTLADWFSRCKGRQQTDLELVLALLAGSGLPERVQAHLLESCKLWVRFSPGPGRSRVELERPVERLHFQREAFPREIQPLKEAIEEPLESARLLDPAEGDALLDLAVLALAVRNLEIYPLTWGHREDVTLVDCGRGLQIALAGTRPGFRSALETLGFFLLLQNGVPIAYGPAGVLLGVCEMGINLFPEFRGGPTRFLYAQLMRVLHHVLGVEHFYLRPYGMGVGNAEARASGAFWFYRRLGFLPANPRVEELARAEEQRMASHRGHRSSAAMLARLARTSAHFDLSGGRCRILSLGPLGLAQSELVAERFGGDRARAEEECAARVAPLLGLSVEDRALRDLAPLLVLLPDLAGWSLEEREHLGTALHAKGGRSEAPAARLLRDHERFAQALHALAAERSQRPRRKATS